MPRKEVMGCRTHKRAEVTMWTMSAISSKTALTSANENSDRSILLMGCTAVFRRRVCWPRLTDGDGDRVLTMVDCSADGRRAAGDECFVAGCHRVTAKPSTETTKRREMINEESRGMVVCLCLKELCLVII